MKNVSDFLLDLENLKAEMGLSGKEISDEIKLILLERKQGELERQAEQLQADIRNNVEELFDFMSLKQANIEALSGINTYLQEELRKVVEQVKEIERKKRA